MHPMFALQDFICIFGSQIFALHSFGEAIDVIVEFAHRVKETYGYEIDEIDVGGGLGIAYTAEDKLPPLKISQKSPLQK